MTHDDGAGRVILAEGHRLLRNDRIEHAEEKLVRRRTRGGIARCAMRGLLHARVVRSALRRRAEDASDPAFGFDRLLRLLLLLRCRAMCSALRRLRPGCGRTFRLRLWCRLRNRRHRSIVCRCGRCRCVPCLDWNSHPERRPGTQRAPRPKQRRKPAISLKMIPRRPRR